MGEKLICPECEGKLAWNGSQHVCSACSWTEYKTNPPSKPADKRKTSKKRKDEKNPKSGSG